MHEHSDRIDVRTPDDEFGERVARHLRASEPLIPGFDARVMAAVRGTPGDLRRRAPRVPWFGGLRPLQLNPLAGLALAASIASLAVLGDRALRGDAKGVGGSAARSGVAESAATDTVYLVRFVISAPGARTVSLVGDFNAWDRAATTLSPTGVDDVWAVTLRMPAGRQQYAFVVDDQWAADPTAPEVRDEFSVVSSVITVGDVNGEAHTRSAS